MITSSLYIAFVGGLAASITPCVYPLIPVTLALFGATPEISRVRAFLLSLSYVLGMAAMYTTLGIFSAFTGSIFGEALRNPWVIACMSLFIIMLSLYTLDIIKFEAAYRWQTKASNIGGKGFLGAFLMGTASGVVAAPCAAPLLITILGIAAQTQSAWLGALLLFVYALGFGLIFLLLGTFSGLIHKIPRSGDWLHMVKFVISAALLTVAIFLLQPLLSRIDINLGFTADTLLLVSFGLIAVLAATIGHRKNLRLVKFICACVLALSLYQVFFDSRLSQDVARKVDSSKIVWFSELDRALAQARSQKTIVMVDFFAQWCASCKELESKTFSAPSIASQLLNMVLLRIDLTMANDDTDSIQQKFNLRGLPSVLFLCADGREIANTRIEGFKEADDFLTHLNRALAAKSECGL